MKRMFLTLSCILLASSCSSYGTKEASPYVAANEKEMLRGIASAKTIQHETCIIYLPVSAEVSSWGGYKQAFIEKGYRPVEFKYDDVSLIKEGVLLGSIRYEFLSESGFATKNTCVVEVGIQEILDSNLTLANLFIGKETQRRLNIFNSSKIKCASADDKIQKKIPSCEIK